MIKAYTLLTMNYYRKTVFTAFLILAALVTIQPNPALAIQLPVVSITAPSDGDDVSGIINIDTSFSIPNGNVHTLILFVESVEVDSVPVHNRNGSYSFSLDTSSYQDGAINILVQAHSASPQAGHYTDAQISVNVSNSACVSDADCDDRDTYTADSCDSPGTPAAICLFEPITCVSDADCDDTDASTIDACITPGSTDSQCTHSSIACMTSADCDDLDPLTFDQCNNAALANASCSNTAIACLENSNCDDANPLTSDTCMNGGTASAQCEYADIACNSNIDCDDDDRLTVDSCSNPGTPDSICSNTSIECLNHTDCDDGDNYTRDTCQNSASLSAQCSHDSIICNSDSDCDDYNPITIDLCSNAGSPDALCSNTSCEIACSSNNECDDNDVLTTDTCNDPGACTSHCIYSSVDAACTSVSDCDDNNADTFDTCRNPSTPQSECDYNPVEPPSLSISTPENDLLTNIPLLTVTGNTTGTRVTVNDTQATVVGGTYSADIILAEGEQTVFVVSSNEGSLTTSDAIDVTLDSVPPEIISYSPDDGSTIAEGAPINFRANIIDPDNGSGLSAQYISIVSDSGNIDFRFNTSTGALESDFIPEDSPFTLTLTIQDRAGNVSPPLMLIYDLQEEEAPESPDTTFPKGLFYSSTLNGGADIYLAWNGKKHLILRESDFEGHPSYSKGKLAYTKEGKGHSKVYILDIMGSNHSLILGRKLKHAGNINDTSLATMSADGSTMVFVAFDPESPSASHGNKYGDKHPGKHKENNHGNSNSIAEFEIPEDSLYILDLDSNTEPRRILSGMEISGTSISPDGSSIVVSAATDNGFSLYILRQEDNFDKTLLFDTGMYTASDPVFSPSGDNLYFITNYNGQFDVFRINLNRGNIEQITDSPEREVRLAFSTENELVCSIRTDTGYDIFRIDIQTGEEVVMITDEGNDLAR